MRKVGFEKRFMYFSSMSTRLRLFLCAGGDDISIYFFMDVPYFSHGERESLLRLGRVAKFLPSVQKFRHGACQGESSISLVMRENRLGATFQPLSANPACQRQQLHPGFL